MDITWRTKKHYFIFKKINENDVTISGEKVLLDIKGKMN